MNPTGMVINRIIAKEPRFYLYANGMVTGDEGVRLENLVACALLERVQRCQVVEDENLDLHYITSVIEIARKSTS